MSHNDLFEISNALEAQALIGEQDDVVAPINALAEAVQSVAQSFSGSWLGYHSRVYYEDFTPPPPGAHFSQEWGLMSTVGTLGSRGAWREYEFDYVKQHILSVADNPDISFARDSEAEAEKQFGIAKPEILSILYTELESGEDQFLENLKDQLESLEPLDAGQVAEGYNQRGQAMTRDTVVLGQGTNLPPHIAVKAEIRSIGHTFAICKEASAIARRAASHLERKLRRKMSQDRVGTNVFIGHGQSGAWRELKDFVQERLRLPWDEFNRVPVAGVTNIARLSEMMEAASVALLVMTAEDEQADGSLQARMNVIHEAGLFQGRLGFTRAIVLLEEGCEEFSNIEGLGQIRFPTGNIAAAFEEVRRVLEREGLIS